VPIEYTPFSYPFTFFSYLNLTYFKSGLFGKTMNLNAHGLLEGRYPLHGLALGALARQALIAEAELTPKPGLVDRRGSGAHSDLSLDMMRRSALAVEPFIAKMAYRSTGRRLDVSLRETLAAIGREAETAMLKATGGSNTHKGAIWTLGLLAAASAIRRDCDALTITSAAGVIASFEDPQFSASISHGQAVAKKYGVSGARGEAMHGFPHIVFLGLPMLRARRDHNAPEHIARIDALLSIMAELDDTCLLYRGGKTALMAAKNGAMSVMRAGGAGSSSGRQRLLELDRRLLTLDASPGGSADLLAGVLFLDAVERNQPDIHPDKSTMEHSHGTV
jgi:triphosphoribosyl-dephospho-CoA synthase